MLPASASDALTSPATATPAMAVAGAAGPIREHRLSNGLLVLTREVHVAPIASFWVWYRVGSRNEVPGITGISHWTEHMVFKGTERFPKGQADKLVAMHGGTRNGSTWLDFTNYHETLPSEHLRLAIEIEADRMANSAFRPEEVAGERGVIISEREGNENSPGFYLGEEVSAAAFKLHPYGLPVVGYKSDLQAIARRDLWAHYRRYYAPNNAVVVAVGDFDTAALLEEIEREFGAIKRRRIPPAPPLTEPEQQGERRVVVSRPGPVPQLSMAYHVPGGGHPDTVALWVLGSLLQAGRSSRLYRALVSAGLASNVGAGSALTRDPYLFRINATARPGVALSQIEDVAGQEVERVARAGVAELELAKVRRQLRAGHLFSTEGVSNQAHYLGMYEIASTWRAFETYLDDLVQVTADDVARVAATYLVPSNRTVGWFVPSTDADPEGAARPASRESAA